MARLAVLQPDPRAAARLSAAISGEHTLIECLDVEALWNVVAKGPVDGCIVDIYHGVHAFGLPELQRLRRHVPPLAIVVYADFSHRELDLFELGRLKIDGVILAGTADEPGETRRAVAGALTAAVALGVTSTLEGQLHPLGMDCLRWAIEHAEDPPTVEQMADWFALTPASLTRELHERHLPTPARLILWGRLLSAARLLANPDRTVEDTAFRLGYSSASALGRAFRRETGFTPSDLRTQGPLERSVEAFLRRESRE